MKNTAKEANCLIARLHRALTEAITSSPNYVLWIDGEELAADSEPQGRHCSIAIHLQGVALIEHGWIEASEEALTIDPWESDLELATVELVSARSCTHCHVAQCAVVEMLNRNAVPGEDRRGVGNGCIVVRVYYGHHVDASEIIGSIDVWAGKVGEAAHDESAAV